MEHKKITTKVNIFGAEYMVKAEAEPDYVQRVAQYVDSKMREITDNLQLRSSTRVAILAAINITDELFKERADKERLGRELEEKLDGVYHRLHKELDEVQRHSQEGGTLSSTEPNGNLE